MFDLFCKLGADKALLNEGAIFDDALSLCFKEFQLLDEVRVVLVKLLILVDIHEESPVIEVVDGVLENGIGGAVTPEAVAKPGGKGFEGFVRGIVRRSI